MNSHLPVGRPDGQSSCHDILHRNPDRPADLDRDRLALLPINGRCIRPAGGRQVVMNAREAAELAGLLRPTVTIPHHSAFHSGRLGDQLITSGAREPLAFVDAAAELAPRTTVRVATPGERVTVP